MLHSDPGYDVNKEVVDIGLPHCSMYVLLLQGPPTIFLSVRPSADSNFLNHHFTSLAEKDGGLSGNHEALIGRLRGCLGVGGGPSGGGILPLSLDFGKHSFIALHNFFIR